MSNENDYHLGLTCSVSQGHNRQMIVDEMLILEPQIEVTQPEDFAANAANAGDAQDISRYLRLNQIPIGRQVRIKSYDSGLNDPAAKRYRQKCLSMGLTPGAVLTLVGVAPLGCPIEIKVRDYYLSLRSQESEVFLCELL